MDFEDSARPARIGKTNGESPASSLARSSTSSAPLDSGTRCSRPAFILAGGIVQTFAAVSISSHVAARASPERAAVKTISSTASRADSGALADRMRRSASGTSPCGSARWCVVPLPLIFGSAATARSTGFVEM